LVNEESFSLFDNENNENKSVKNDETDKDPFKMEVLVSRVITPYCIYVAQKEREKSIAAFMLRMQKFYDTYYSPPRNDWCEGASCAIYSAKDKRYFRAKILKINSPMEVLVYLYDMGIEKTTTLKDIQSLNSEFMQEPIYYFKVKLAGILPCDELFAWSLFSCITLSDIIQQNANSKFYITKLVISFFDEYLTPFYAFDGL
jgi:hypothetical protein